MMDNMYISGQIDSKTWDLAVSCSVAAVSCYFPSSPHLIARRGDGCRFFLLTICSFLLFDECLVGTAVRL